MSMANDIIVCLNSISPQISKHSSYMRIKKETIHKRHTIFRLSEYTSKRMCTAYNTQNHNRAPGNREEAGNVPGGRATEVEEQVRTATTTGPADRRRRASKA